MLTKYQVRQPKYQVRQTKIYAVFRGASFVSNLRKLLAYFLQTHIIWTLCKPTESKCESESDKRLNSEDFVGIFLTVQQASLVPFFFYMFQEFLLVFAYYFDIDLDLRII